MNTTIVKTREVHDFLALVPQLVGFQPENSVVLVAFRGNRSCGALRFTLPPAGSPPKLLKRIATSLVGTLCRVQGVTSVVPVVYTDEPFTSVAGLPQEMFAESLVARAELSGFRVRDALCVGPDAWGSYLNPRCPAGGHPLSAIENSPVHGSVPEAARRGLSSLRSRTELPEVDVALKERFARRYARYRRLGGHPGPGSGPGVGSGVGPGGVGEATSAEALELVALVGDVLDPVATAEVALTWEPARMHQNDAAALLFLVQGPAVRDQMMLQFAFGEETGRRTHALNLRYAALQHASGRTVDELVQEELERTGTLAPGAEQTSSLMLGLSRERPDPDRIERAVTVLMALVALAPRSARPAPFCMLAWLSWALGRGSVAGIFIDRALAIEPGYPMAGLLNTLIGSGHLPEWAFAVPEDETSA